MNLEKKEEKKAEVLDAMNWTRWRVGAGASFHAIVLFRDDPA